MKFSIAILFFVLNFQSGFAQNENLIPNHDFEKNSQVINKDFIATTSNEFNNLVSDWNSPTTTSPDLVKENISSTKVGIVVYGSGNCRPTDWREYIQVKLKRKVIRGKKYQLTFKVQLKEGTAASNNLGFLFRGSPITQNGCERIKEVPQIKFNEIIQPENNQWKTIQTEFISDSNYEYLIIGNFNSDRETKLFGVKNLETRSSYLVTEILEKVSQYYFDEIQLIEL